MDAEVVAAMARWPNVPSVYGWLSLTAAGQWRLHPDGNAIREPDSVGEPITSPQIIAFIDRNYDTDGEGRWFFQNGPQRVFVRLDAAPFIVHVMTDAATGELKLRTHTGLDVRAVSAWHLDEEGRLFAATERGAALISGRDVPILFDRFATPDSAHPATDDERSTDTNELLTQCMESGTTVHIITHSVSGVPIQPLPLKPGSTDTIARELGFIRLPSDQ